VAPTSEAGDSFRVKSRRDEAMTCPFLIDDARIQRLAATRAGRLSLGGYVYQTAYAVARLAAMLPSVQYLILRTFRLVCDATGLRISTRDCQTVAWSSHSARAAPTSCSRLA